MNSKKKRRSVFDAVNRVLQCAAWLMFIGMCLHSLLGWPIPIIDEETLFQPMAVQELTETEIVLGDGRRLRLPHIRRIPTAHPLFLVAVKDGVELSGDGQLTGLLRETPVCSLVAVYRRRVRVNLTDLAAACAVENIEPGIPGEYLPFLRDQQLDPVQCRADRFDYYDIARIRHFAAALDDSIRKPVVVQTRFSESFLKMLSRTVSVGRQRNEIQLAMAVLGILVALTERRTRNVIGAMIGTTLMSVTCAGILLDEWWSSLCRSSITQADAEWIANHDGGLLLVGIEILFKAGIGLLATYLVHRAVQRRKSSEAPPQADKT